MGNVTRSRRTSLFSPFFILMLIAPMLLQGMACPRQIPSLPPEEQSAAMVQAPDAGVPLPSAPQRTPQEVRTPLPPPTIDRSPQPSPTPPHGYEDATLDSVLPGGSTTFDPFTYGRPGSPYGPGKLFTPGLGAGRCGPMELPMSSEFIGPGDKQAVIIIIGDGIACRADIDHDKPGAAIAFPLVTPIFTNPPWTIISLSATSVTITNGTVRIRFEYRITPSVTIISKVDYL